MLTVAAVPSAHPYVAHILPSAQEAGPDASAYRLADPTPQPPPADPAVWWPPRVVDPVWIREHAADVDLVHLHFGFESFSAEHLRAWVDALAQEGVPLVFTVHDLENPHLLDQAAHAAALDVLVPAAAAVVTLTDGAAREIARRWGVQATVVPHPLMASPAAMERADALRATRDPGAGPRIGMPLGAVRAGTDPSPFAARLVDAARAAGATLDVTVNEGARPGPDQDPRRSRIVTVVAQSLGADGALRFTPRLPEEDLHAWVAGLDVLVLPYRHGTHSGWLELAWDLGTSVLSPAHGHVAEQHPDPRFLATFDAPSRLGDALSGLLAARAPGTVPWGDAAQRATVRDRELAEVRAAHTRLYRAVAGRP